MLHPRDIIGELKGQIWGTLQSTMWGESGELSLRLSCSNKLLSEHHGTPLDIVGLMSRLPQAYAILDQILPGWDMINKSLGFPGKSIHNTTLGNNTMSLQNPK